MTISLAMVGKRESYKLRKVPRYRDQLRASKQKHLKRKMLFVFGLVVIVAICLGYLLFFAKLLDVRTIEIQSDNESTEIKDSLIAEVNTWLDQKKYFLERRRNIFFTDTKELEVLLSKRLPKIDSIEVSRDLLHTLNVKISERTPHGIWCNTNSDLEKCFYFNTKGIIYEPAPKTTGFLVLKVSDERDIEIQTGEQILDDRWIKAIDNAYTKLPQKKFKVKSLVIPRDSLNDFYILTESNLKILIDINTDVPGQIDAMASFVSQKFTAEKLAQLQYIDLRIQDRIYYR